MAKTTVTVDGLAAALADAVAEYSDETTAEVKAACKKVADDCKNEIKAKSPRKSGRYMRGWGVVKSYEDAHDVRYTVRNKDAYQLTHLLEFGHLNRDGTTRADKFAHIRPAAEKATADLEKDIKNIYGRG